MPPVESRTAAMMSRPLLPLLRSALGLRPAFANLLPVLPPGSRPSPGPHREAGAGQWHMRRGPLTPSRFLTTTTLSIVGSGHHQDFAGPLGAELRETGTETGTAMATATEMTTPTTTTTATISTLTNATETTTATDDNPLMALIADRLAPSPALPRVPTKPISASVRALLPVLAAQPAHYITVHIFDRPYLVTAGDSVRLPFLMRQVRPGDVLRLNRASVLGSRDYTLKGRPFVDDRLFECRATVLGVESEPMRVKTKRKQRNRRVKKVHSKHRFTILRISELRICQPPLEKEGVAVDAEEAADGQTAAVVVVKT